jgi:predicted PurR-regulated permease PerM
LNISLFLFFNLREKKEIRKYVAQAFKAKKKNKIYLAQPVDFASTSEEE